jgi:UDP-glucose:(heptosyl)LPS alpha-1,3-glucosyltransferase
MDDLFAAYPLAFKGSALFETASRVKFPADCFSLPQRGGIFLHAVPRAPRVQKIAVVIPKYGLVGGAEGFAAELTERIARNDRYEIHVFANQWRQGSPRILFHKIPIISFPKFLTTISFAYFAKRKIDSMNFDLIHTHDRIFQADLFTMHGIPHRIWVTEVRKRNMTLFDIATKWVERCLVQNQSCQRFLTVSHLVKEKFLQEYGHVDSKRIQIIYPGVDVQRFQRLDRHECKDGIRTQWGIEAKDLVVLFVSMNFEIKGLSELMAGLAKLKSKYPSQRFKLLVIGKGNVRKYEKLARGLGIQEHVLFLGIVHKETLDRIYLAGDILAMLSQFDTFGIAVLEAMAASLPVLISRNVGAKDIVQEGTNGFTVENTNSPDEISEKIAILLNEEIRSRMGDQALKTASRFTWEAAAKKVEIIYEDLLEGK